MTQPNLMHSLFIYIFMYLTRPQILTRRSGYKCLFWVSMPCWHLFVLPFLRKHIFKSWNCFVCVCLLFPGVAQCGLSRAERVECPGSVSPLKNSSLDNSLQKPASVNVKEQLSTYRSEPVIIVIGCSCIKGGVMLEPSFHTLIHTDYHW